MQYFTAIIAAVFYLYAIILAGYLLIRLTPIEDSFLKRNIFLQASISGLLGLSVINLIWLIAGLYLSLSVVTVAIVLFIPIVFIKHQIELWNQLKAVLAKIPGYLKKAPAQTKLLLAFNTCCLLVFGLTALILLPTGDSEGFYMVWPKLISYLNEIVVQPNYYDFSQIGISGELHFAALMLFGGGHSATFLIWFIVIFITCILVDICKYSGLSDTAIQICILLLYTSSAFTGIINHGNVNLFSAGYAIAGVYCLIALFDVKESKQLLVFAGLFFGTAVVAKLSYIVILVPIVLSMLFFHFKQMNTELNIKRVTQTFAYLAIPALIILCFHFLKNYSLFNEPFAPFFYLNSENQAFIGQVWYSGEITRWIISTYPIALTFGIYPMQAGNISPVLFMLLPVIFITRSELSSLKSNEKIPFYLLTGSIISLLLWMVTNPSILAPRYILITFILMFPYFCRIYDRIENITFKKTVFVSIILIGSLSILKSNIPVSIWMVTNELQNNRDKNYRYYESAQILNNITTYDSRVYLAGYSSYFLRPDIIKNLQTPDDPDIIRGGLLNNEDFEFLYVQKLIFNDHVNQYLNTDEMKLIYEDERAVIYQIMNYD